MNIIFYTSLIGKKLYCRHLTRPSANYVYSIPSGLVMEQVPETRVSGTRSTMEKWVEGKLNKAFLHFFVKLLTYLMIF